MAYIDREIFAGNYYNRKQYHTGRYHPPGERRAKLRNPSPESVATANMKRATDNLMWKLNENFDLDDWWITLTYRGDHKTRDADAMAEDFFAFLKALRKLYRQNGEEVRFCSVMRVGKRGSRHFHMVLGALEEGKMKIRDFRKELQKIWPFGFVQSIPVWDRDDSGLFDFIAKYMIEESEITRKTLDRPNMKRYSCSRNLRAPTVKRHVVKRSGSFRCAARVPKGYKLLKDSEKLEADAWGHICYTYTCIRITPSVACGDSSTGGGAEHGGACSALFKEVKNE